MLYLDKAIINFRSLICDQINFNICDAWSENTQKKISEK